MLVFYGGTIFAEGNINFFLGFLITIAVMGLLVLVAMNLDINYAFTKKLRNKTHDQIRFRMQHIVNKSDPFFQY